MLPASTPQDPHAGGLRIGRRFTSEPALADSGLARDREQAPATRQSFIDARAEFGEFVNPVDERFPVAIWPLLAHLHSIQAEPEYPHPRTLTKFTENC